MIFHRTRLKRDSYSSLYFDNKQIANVKVTKFLGIIIDENLNWSNHISYIKNEIFKDFEIIHRSRKLFSKKTYG